MEIPWHDYTGDDSNVLISDAELIEKHPSSDVSV